MKILALITARGGSKRLPRKNIRVLGGKPLINWTIDVAKKIPEICDVLVSTDDAEIAAISIEAGGLVPWLRPKELATDTASSADVALHSLNWYEKNKGSIDGILLLQPTSPFRSEITILRGIELFEKYGYQPVLGVSYATDQDVNAFELSGERLIQSERVIKHNLYEQDSGQKYIVNGCLYLTSPASLRTHNSFLGNKIIPLLIESKKEAMDIDTKADFEMAELMAVEYIKVPE